MILSDATEFRHPPLHPRLCMSCNYELHCISIENIPDIIDCNLKNDCQMLVDFGTNILREAGT